MSNAPQEDAYEIFISYSHKDNFPPPLSASKQGWVTYFDEFLAHYLREQYGEVRIWRDDVMRGSDVIDETILQPLPNVSVMIVVVSPNYITSQWCSRELNEFCDAAAHAHGGVKVRNRSRIFNVAKVPLRKGQQLPEVISNARGFKFYQDDDKDKKPLFFGPHEPKPEAQQLFNDRVGDVAWEVIELLDLIKEHAQADAPAAEAAPAAEPPSRGVYVYLAEVAADLLPQRDNIRRDLLHHGYNIVELSYDDRNDGDLDNAVLQDLRRCGFSVHLVGNEFGERPPGSPVSLVERQVALAEKRAEESQDFQRLIWIPDGVRPQHVTQRKFVNELLESNFNRNTELVRRALENFKTVVHDKINPPQPVEPPRGAAPAPGVQTIGIICDRLDVEHAARLNDCLYEQGRDVTVFEAGGAEVLSEEHVRGLAVCDGVVVYMDSAPLLWVQTRLRDIAEAEERSGREFRAVAVYVGGPKTKEKEQFRTRKAVVIKNFEDAPAGLLGPIPPHLLRPLLDKLDDEERGQAS